MGISMEESKGMTVYLTERDIETLTRLLQNRLNAGYDPDAADLLERLKDCERVNGLSDRVRQDIVFFSWDIFGIARTHIMISIAYNVISDIL